jgi:hypothetical protein
MRRGSLRAQAVVNQAPKGGAAALYVRVPILFVRDKVETALFTQTEIRRALERAKKNREDVEYPEIYRP